MNRVTDPDPATFLRRTEPFRRSRPALTNVISTLAEARASGLHPDEPGTRWYRLVDGDELVGIALRTPSRGILLSPMPAAAAETFGADLAEESRIHEGTVPYVNGPAETSTAFTRAYCEGTGATYEIGLAQRVLTLSTVIQPDRVPGRPRVATPADLDLVHGWHLAFLREAVPQEPNLPGVEDTRRRTAVPGSTWLWEDGGEPVSMCWRSAAVAGLVRVSAVYTPPELRGYGYASANVAAISQDALDRGALACLLYTDAANPVSNRIYERVGYGFAGEATAYVIRPAGGSPGSAPAS